MSVWPHAPGRSGVADVGGDLDDPSFVEAYCAEVVPRLLEIPGNLGLFVLLDREQVVLRGISFWGSLESRERSMVVVGRVVDALQRLTSTQFQGHWNYDVVVNSFRGVLGQATQRSEVDHLIVRTGVITGGDLGDPAVIELLRTHTATAVLPVKGCVGALLLSDPTRPAVLGASFWVDADAAERSQGLGAAARDLIIASTGSTPSGIGTYEVLANAPMLQSV